MDLKIRDVVELLRVSETTVRRWLKLGLIPAYRLNRQYRFDRAELEDWMMRCKLKLETNDFSCFNERSSAAVAEEEDGKIRAGMQQFSLYRAMHKGGVIVNLPIQNKKVLIEKVMHMKAQQFGLDPDLMTELLMDREELMSTALNSGLAVPHPRDIVLEIPGSDTIITVFPEDPIEYGALDGQPVHTLFFLLSASDKTHLHLLSKLAHLGSQPAVLRFLVTKPTQEALLSFVKDWETNVIKPLT